MVDGYRSPQVAEQVVNQVGRAGHSLAVWRQVTCQGKLDGAIC